jgi:putative ABC transport system substrate-binding protein
MAIRIGRRRFLAVVGAAAAWPVAARAQQPAMPVVGYLSSISTDPYGVAAFIRGLLEQGFVEGRNVKIEYRSAEGQYDRLPALAADLVSLPANVIAAVSSSPAALEHARRAQKHFSEIARHEN